MIGWTPLWSSIVDSSVWGEDKDVKILWITMLAKKDKHGMVEMSLPGLARSAVLTLEECRRALDVLLAPDPHSRTSANDGRRVESVEGGWFILNHLQYREITKKLIQREQQSQWMRDKRAGVSELVSGNGSSSATTPSEPAPSVEPVDMEFALAGKPTMEQVKLAGEKIGLPDSQCEQFWHFYESKGWKVNKSPMKSWRSALAGWHLRWKEKRSYEGNSTGATSAMSLQEKILMEAVNAPLPEMPA